MASPAVNSAALITDLEGLRPSAHVGHRCQTASMLSRLEPEKRVAVQALIDRDDLSAPDVCGVLARHGLEVSTANLRRHRKRGAPNGCKCPQLNEATSA